MFAYLVAMLALALVGVVIGSFVMGEFWNPLETVERRGALAWLSIGGIAPIYAALGHRPNTGRR